MPNTIPVEPNRSTGLSPVVRNLLGLRFVLPLLAGSLLASPATQSSAVHTTGCTSPSSPEATAVRVTAERDGDLTRFFVENNEYSEITMTLDMSVVNLKGNVQFPYTAT